MSEPTPQEKVLESKIYIFEQEGKVAGISIVDPTDYGAYILPENGDASSTEGTWRIASPLSDVNGEIMTYTELCEWVMGQILTVDRVYRISQPAPDVLKDLHKHWLDQLPAGD